MTWAMMSLIHVHIKLYIIHFPMTYALTLMHVYVISDLIPIHEGCMGALFLMLVVANSYGVALCGRGCRRGNPRACFSRGGGLSREATGLVYQPLYTLVCQIV
jgi:hypothetical protein